MFVTILTTVLSTHNGTVFCPLLQANGFRVLRVPEAATILITGGMRFDPDPIDPFRSQVTLMRVQVLDWLLFVSQWFCRYSCDRTYVAAGFYFCNKKVFTNCGECYLVLLWVGCDVTVVSDSWRWKTH